MLQRHSSVAARFAAAGSVGIALAAAGLTVGCGQKGPLTLPKATTAAASASSPASAASTAQPPL
jgi:predicted small lipoprotein YifL